ncbi:MAG: PcfJ domain-containing protein [Akkermansiaceae bacterium]|nr:PcfJ domain-containing protein [Akkermansiaceae bacterium]
MPAFTPPPRPGFRFSEGKLRIFRADEVMLIAGWPEPSAVRKSGDTAGWEAFQPEFRLIAPYRRSAKKKVASGKAESAAKDRAHGKTAVADGSQLAFDFGDEPRAPSHASPPPKPDPRRERKRAFDAFRFSLPKEVARVLEPFRSHQWPLLVMLRDDPGSLDLARSNPCLAFLLAQKLKADRGLIASLRCGSLPQRDLLGLLDFPESKWAANVFRKVQPACLDGENWKDLLRLLRTEDEDVRRRLSHLPAINPGVAAILLNREAFAAAGAGLLEAVANDPRENHRAGVVHRVTATLSMLAELPERRRPGGAGRIASLEPLNALHDAVSAAYREWIRERREARRHGHENFRLPPVPGLRAAIEPLQSPEALIDEGEEQHNCVASYAAKVVRGAAFLYRVLKPQRATLSLVRGAGGDWEIGELKAKYNDPVAPRTRRFVESWLDEHRVSA